MPQLPIFTPGGFSSGGQIDINDPLRKAQIKVEGIQAGAQTVAKVGEVVGNVIQEKQNRQWLMERDTADNQLHLDQQDFDRHWLANDRFDASELEAAGVEGVQLTKNVGGQEVSRGQVPTAEFLPDFRFNKVNQRIDELAEGIGNSQLRKEWVDKQKGRNAERFASDTIKSAQVQRQQRQDMLDEQYNVAWRNEEFEYMRDLIDTMELTNEERKRRMQEIDVAQELTGIDEVLLNGSDAQKSALEKQLRDTEIASFLTTKERLQKANQLKASVQNNKVKRDKIAEMRLKERIAEKQSGTDNGLTEAEANVFSDPAKVEEVKRKIRVANEVGDFQHEFYQMSAEQQQAELSQLAEQMRDPGNFFEEEAVFKGKAQAITQFARDFSQDPVRTVTSVDPELQQKQQELVKMENAVSNGTADPALLQQAQIDYRENLIAAQERMGVRRDDAVLMSEAQVAAIGSNFMAATGEEKLTQLNSMQVRFGNYWPMVMKQLQKEKVLTGIDRIGGAQDPFLDGAITEALYRGQANGSATELYNRTGLERAAKTTFEASIRDALQKFDHTLVVGQDNSRLYDDMYDAVETTALQMILEGSANPNNAAEKAATGLMYNKYHEINVDDTFHQYRMPMNRGLSTGGVSNPSVIRSTLEAVRRNPQLYDYDAPVSRAGFQDITGKQAEESRRKRSYWVNNPNDTGVILMDEDKSPVLKDGRLVSMTWAEIEALEPPRSNLAAGGQGGRRRATAPAGAGTEGARGGR
jgi:hypothetical protein